MSIGGSIEAVSLAGRSFAVAADADSNRDLGGFSSELQPNGDGSVRKIMTRKPWKIDGLTLSISDDQGDQEFLQNIIDSPDYVAMAVTYVSGETYQGKGTIIDDMTVASQAQTASVSLSGPEKLTKQA